MQRYLPCSIYPRYLFVSRVEGISQSGEGPHQGAPGAQSDYWFPIYCFGPRLCSNIAGILDCFSRTSERKIVLVAIATRVRAPFCRFHGGKRKLNRSGEIVVVGGGNARRRT